MATLQTKENGFDYHGKRIDAMSVWIDGQLVSDRVGAFNAASGSIDLTLCEECYCLSCSQNIVAVRKHKGYVYWFHIGEFYEEPIIAEAEPRHLWKFSQENYEVQLDGSAAQLPSFSAADIKLILNRGPLYPRDLGLYVIPDCDEDPQGRRMLDLVAEFAASNELAIVQPPAEFDSHRIGIETEGVPEVQLDVGEVDGQKALRFGSRPYFPLWVSINKRGML